MAGTRNSDDHKSREIAKSEPIRRGEYADTVLSNGGAEWGEHSEHKGVGSRPRKRLKKISMAMGDARRRYAISKKRRRAEMKRRACANACQTDCEPVGAGKGNGVLTRCATVRHFENGSCTRFAKRKSQKCAGMRTECRCAMCL